MDSPRPDLRDFEDHDATRQAIYDGVLETLGRSFPVSDGVHRIELLKPHYDGKQDWSWTEQKRALVTDRRLQTPVKGTWRLVDEASGTVLDERPDTIMHVPYYTPRGTFIIGGNEFTTVNQQRLKAGVYTRVRKSGEPEAQFNVIPGKGGLPFRLWMEPETGVMRVNVGTANIPALPMLRAMGVTDVELRKAWGDELMAANLAKTDMKAIPKLYKHFAGRQADPNLSEEEQARQLRVLLANAKLDPAVVRRTMGIDTDTVTPAVLMRATQKLANISRGDEEPDDRDAPMFSRVMAVDDLVRERIEKDAGRTARDMLYRVRRDRNLKRVYRGALDPYIESLIQGSGLVQPLEETNPLQLYEQHHRLTRMGEGGLPSSQAITEEARDVNPGQVGFIDAIAGPESEMAGIDTRISWKTWKGKDGTLVGEFLDKKGEPTYLSPEEMDGKVVSFPGEDPAKGYVLGVKDGRVDRFKPEEIDYTVPSMAHMYGHGINLEPMPTGYMPGRAFYASKYYGQFMPLVKGEAPLVQTEVPGQPGVGFHDYYGREVGTLRAPADGIVTKVTDAGMKIRTVDGQQHFVETVKDFPFNRMTGISYSPMVQEGAVVKRGEPVAHSNFTDAKGTLALGINLKTAVLPASGYTYDDAYAISESAAKRLASSRMYGFDKDAVHGTEIDRKKFVSLFPKKFTNDQLAKLDERGVVQEGMILHKGDPIILATGPRTLSARDAELGKLHKILRRSHRDESVEWENDEPGVVTDVGYTGRGARVNIKSEASVQEGDKLVQQGASKGVVGKILPDGEMPTDPITGEPYDMLFNPMAVLSRLAPNQLLIMQLAKVAKARGQPIKLPQAPPPEGWVTYVANELAAAGIPDKVAVNDPKTGKPIGPVSDGYMYVSAFHHLADKKLCVSAGTEVLTERGWVRADQVRKDDRLATYNPHTRETEYHQPRCIDRYAHAGLLYHVTGDGHDELVNSEHRLWHNESFVRVAALLELVEEKA